MTYTEDGDRVTLEMTRDDFKNLLLVLGQAAGAAHKQGNMALFYSHIGFANRLNATNPNFIPYKIPEEYEAIPHQ